MLVQRAFTPVTLTITFETHKELLDFKAMCNWSGQVQKVVDGNVDEDDHVTSVDLTPMLGKIHDQLNLI